MHWTNKVIIVTGGSAGLGRTIAQHFANRGASVVIVARGQERLERTAENLRQSGACITPLVADVTQNDQVDRIIAQTIEKHGRMDVLVNNVGQSDRQMITDTTVDDFRKLFEINFWPIVRCTQSAIRHLEKTAGSIVNIGSLASKSVGFHLGAYPATKFALAAYSAQLRLELAPKGIHVLLVCPGTIERDDAGTRYDNKTDNLPQSARQPGAGLRLSALNGKKVAKQIVKAIERRQAELVVPSTAKLLFALSHLAPQWADVILKKKFNRQ